MKISTLLILNIFHHLFLRYIFIHKELRATGHNHPCEKLYSSSLTGCNSSHDLTKKENSTHPMESIDNKFVMFDIFLVNKEIF
jgi:hypothetical protein